MTMKRLVSLIALTCCAAQAGATEYRFVADDASPVTRFCVAAGEDDIDGLRAQIRKMRQSTHLQYRTLVNSIRCNDEIAVQFANRYGASETFSYLYRLTSKENREQVPYTSVEELADESRSEGESDMVLVHVQGR
jgi:hypothetical protein